MKRVIPWALGCAIALLLVPSAASAQSVGGCQLDGTASFTPGLTTNAQDFSYSFNGDLSSCRSSESGAPATGTVSAGEVVTVNGLQYQEPVATGNGGCSSSTTAGTAIATWADGTQTVINYTTSGALAAVSLQGTVADSVTLPQVGGMGSTTVTTTRYAGDTAQGLFAFEPPDPTACTTPSGVTSAGISGLVSLRG